MPNVNVECMNVECANALSPPPVPLTPDRLIDPEAAVRRVLKPAVFVAALLPFLYLLWRAAMGELSANPIEDITLTTGRWTLRFLLITLAVTPLRRFTGWQAAIRFRRMLGLFAFFYGTLHLLTYVVLDQFFAWHVHPAGHRQAALHHRRVRGVRPDGAAGAHLHVGHDPAAGRPALGAAAPARST